MKAAGSDERLCWQLRSKHVGGKNGSTQMEQIFELIQVQSSAVFACGGIQGLAS